MLDNKYVLVAALVLFLGAAGYNVWFFFLAGEDGGGGGTVVGDEAPTATAPAGPASPPDESAPADSGLAAMAALVRSARAGRLPLRSSVEVERVTAPPADGESAWGRDPLARPGDAQPEQAVPQQPPPQPPSWRLGAVMTGGDRDVAVINDQVYSEGDAIDGGRVVEIERGRVVIRWRGRRFVLEPDGGR